MDFNNLKDFQRSNLILTADIDFNETAILLALRCYEPNIFVSASTLAFKMQTTRQKIVRHLTRLKNKNLLEENARLGYSTLRVINYKELAKIQRIQEPSKFIPVTKQTHPPLLSKRYTPCNKTNTPPVTKQTHEVFNLSNNIRNEKNETNVSSENGERNENREQGEASEETLFADTSGSGFGLFKEVLKNNKKGLPHNYSNPSG